MALRSGVTITPLWILVDMTQVDAPTIVSAARAVHEGQGDWVLSVNEKADGTRALIKLIQDGSWTTVSPTILRTYTEADHDEALTLVNDATWTGL